MIETKLFSVINDQVAAVTTAGEALNPLFGLDVHDNLWRRLKIDEKPDAIRVGRASGEKTPTAGSDQMIEAFCNVPLWVYVRIAGNEQDDGTAREAAFERADAIANALLLWLWNGGAEAAKLTFSDGVLSFDRSDHEYDSNPYAVVSLSIVLSEFNC